MLCFFFGCPWASDLTSHLLCLRPAFIWFPAIYCTHLSSDSRVSCSWLSRFSWLVLFLQFPGIICPVFPPEIPPVFVWIFWALRCILSFYFCLDFLNFWNYSWFWKWRPLHMGPTILISLITGLIITGLIITGLFTGLIITGLIIPFSEPTVQFLCALGNRLWLQPKACVCGSICVHYGRRKWRKHMQMDIIS